MCDSATDNMGVSKTQHSATLQVLSSSCCHNLGSKNSDGLDAAVHRTPDASDVLICTQDFLGADADVLLAAVG